jgi:hypothetical protein
MPTSKQQPRIPGVVKKQAPPTTTLLDRAVAIGPQPKVPMQDGQPEYDRWRLEGKAIRTELNKDTDERAWRITKWLRRGYDTFLGPNSSNVQRGSLIMTASYLSGLSKNTIKAYAAVAGQFPKGKTYELSFAHYRLLATIRNKPEERDKIAKFAVETKLSVAKMRRSLPKEPPKPFDPVVEAKRYTKRLEQFYSDGLLWDKIIRAIDDRREPPLAFQYSMLQIVFNEAYKILCKRAEELNRVCKTRKFDEEPSVQEKQVREAAQLGAEVALSR